MNVGFTQDRFFATILLATDLTPASEPATDRAIELAGQLGASLLVMHVLEERTGALRRTGLVRRSVEDREDRALAADAIVERARRSGATATYLIWDGDPVDGIVAAADAESADLIVVGARRQGAVGQFFGSVSMGVIRRASVPVLVARGPDRPSGGTA